MVPWRCNEKHSVIDGDFYGHEFLFHWLADCKPVERERRRHGMVFPKTARILFGHQSVVSGLDIQGIWLALLVKVRLIVFISLRDLLHDMRKTKQIQQLVKKTLLVVSINFDGFHCTPYFCTLTVAVLFWKHFLLEMVLSNIHLLRKINFTEHQVFIYWIFHLLRNGCQYIKTWNLLKKQKRWRK